MADVDAPGAALSRRALDAVQRDPRAAIALAARVLDLPATRTGGAVRAVAERAAGLAWRELNDLARAEHHLRRAVRTARRAGSPRVAALARMSLGLVLAHTGRNAAALRAVGAALAHLDGADAGHARLQRGVVQHYRGRYVEAIRDYGVAVDIGQREGDLLLEARARNNRGVLLGLNGGSGEVDLDRARSIFLTLGLDLAAADTHWNVGHAAVQRGDVAAALRVFVDTEREYGRLEVPRPALLLDRFELLLSVPLIDEAAAVAARAVAELGRRDMASDLAEAQLAGARAALLAGDLDSAAATAARARGGFLRQRRRVWADFAQHVELRAAFRRGGWSAALLAAMVRSAGALDAAGWSDAALITRVEAARVAVAVGRPQRARALLRTAMRARRAGPARQRAEGWYATALLRRLDGDGRGAAVAVRRGLAVLDAHRATLGATELRTNSGAHAQELVREGLDLAIGAGGPARVLAWAERWRAGALRMTPIRPPADPALAALLTELRAVSRAVDEALFDRSDPQPMRRRQARLEQQIRDLVRRSAGPGTKAVRSPPTVRTLAAALGRRVLVELVNHDDRMWAVVVRDGRSALHDLGRVDEAVRHARRCRFALRRLATMGDTDQARKAVANATTRLDEQVFGQFRDRLADRPLVVVPVGELHALPWAALPTCAGRPVTVVPSAAVWLDATRRVPPVGVEALVAGPRLPEAEAEIAALTAVLPAARVLTGPDATVDSVMGALNGSRLVHLAAHGRFRADNPLFSTLALADGPLTAYDLEALTDPPGCVVLPACDAGLSAVRPGDELLGFTTVLLGLGTRNLVACLLPVPAARTAVLMLDLHRRLLAGVGPSVALAEAQRAFTRDSDATAAATAAAFVCFGAG